MTELSGIAKESTYSYDEIPYPSHPFEATHPDHIYSLAKLFQLQPTLPENARILELGCASGGNIIPLADQFPNATVVGVDLSSKQIADGQKIVQALGLKNIRLIADDFQAINEAYGDFDYILCHGVFSWVPPVAQQRILEICQERLTPHGVAYISYNAYPGWFMRGMIRQMMLYHVSNLPDPASKIQQARALLSFIVASTEGQTTPYAQVLKSELELLGKHPDSYLFHEHLEENNRPMFFYQFMEMAKGLGLQFLGETSLASMITSNLPPKAADALSKLTTDVYHRSQYTDFVTNRMFRQSLLCRADVKLDRHLSPSRMEGVRYAGNIKLEDPSLMNNLSPEVEVAFKCPNGRKLQTKHSALKALMFALVEAWPKSMDVPELCKIVEKKLSELVVVGERESISISQLVTTNMLQLVVRGDVEFRCVPDRFVTELSSTPKVSALVRLQASQGGPVTTQRHSMVNLDPLTRLITQEVDGTKTHGQLADHLASLAEQGKVNINIKGGQNVDMKSIHTMTIDKVLAQLRQHSLLVG
ncbi:tRNA (guanine-N(7)-)-methyltransferase [Pirellula sp. SH-Sr6A]|uniref:class I SAM-dependent methyltransferase n=1 Tax=Pirellula sp. SH-Sr6A TaxID=1632865 RepID=UPI00078EBAAD|nr:class I SAM-dependent methyltransferase [Pirellula sp. SH-Sr6A]AMV30640.1 tRNA (guanine-N(7)-)-methyltransferase [Pirellula sp. SH-Sr6A]